MSDYPIKSPRKLIEVALPLEAINKESLRRKQKAPKGWPTSFHKWWAQRPLAAARAVIFGQLVNDPSWQWELDYPGKIPPNHLKASWAKSRKRLFALIEELVLWDNSANQEVLEKARGEIRRSWREVCELNKNHPRASELFNQAKMPAVQDPFAGSGTIPLEAQRLGLDAIGSDLNPVAVLINKALLEFPHTFSGYKPICLSEEESKTGGNTLGLVTEWKNGMGLAEDVRYYGNWIREEAVKRIGNLYPPILVTHAMTRDRPDLTHLVGQKLTVVAWLWARTVKSPNPAFSHVQVPLASNFVLSSKAGKEAYVFPIIKGDEWRFTVKIGTPPPDAQDGTKTKGKGSNFHCIVSKTPISGEYIKSEGRAGRMGQSLLAVVVEGARGRLYLPPTIEQEELAKGAAPDWAPSVVISGTTQYLGIKPYGMDKFSQLFTNRQLRGFSVFFDLVLEALPKLKKTALAAGLPDDERCLDKGGKGAIAYAEAVAVYLACVLDRMLYYGSSLTTWLPKDNALRDCMPRQALAMTWDFAEANPLAKSSGDILTCIKAVSNYLDVAAPYAKVVIKQEDACTGTVGEAKRVFSTDPPYYDNVPYADLSDFFYVWLRRSLRPIFPDLFATVSVPKAEELVAFAYRHEDGKAGAEAFFLKGMTKAMWGGPESPATERLK